MQKQTNYSTQVRKPDWTQLLTGKVIILVLSRICSYKSLVYIGVCYFSYFHVDVTQVFLYVGFANALSFFKYSSTFVFNKHKCISFFFLDCTFVLRVKYLKLFIYFLLIAFRMHQRICIDLTFLYIFFPSKHCFGFYSFLTINMNYIFTY